MAHTWLRLYAEFADDPKVQMMSEAMQRRLIMLFCLRCSNALETLQDEEVAFRLRCSETDIAETKALFVAKGFIDDHWNIVNWENRQFVSDSSTERVRQYRRGRKQCETFPKQDETELKRSSNALDTDTDTDTEKNKSKPPAAKLLVFPDWVNPEAWSAWEEMRKRLKKPLTDHARKLAIAELGRLRASGNDPTEVINRSTLRGWMGFFPLEGVVSSSLPSTRKTNAELLAECEAQDAP